MKRLLIVVDYQNDFVNGTLGFDGAELLERRIAEKICAYRQNNDDVTFTLDTHEENYLSTQEGKNLPIPHCIKNTDGGRLFGTIAALRKDTDRCFEKPTFGSDGLYEWLKTTDYTSIELVGLVSNICVISNAVLAKTALPEAEIIIDASCTAAADTAINKAALDVMSGLQMKVINRI